VHRTASIRRLLEFQRSKGRDPQQLINFIADDTLREFSVLNLFLGVVKSNGALHLPYSTGHNSDLVKSDPVRILDVNTPGYDAYVNGKIVETGDILEYPFYHPENSQLIFPTGFEYSAIFPVPSFGALLMYCDKPQTLDEDRMDFLYCIGEILSICLTSGDDGEKFDVDGQEPAPVSLLPLTARQWAIKDAMLRGLTNGAIAREMNFSESLIRHETIRIYSKLGISGRKQLFALNREAGNN
jgi:DNA-binding CsgD family transcriptional regulator